MVRVLRRHVCWGSGIWKVGLADGEDSLKGGHMVISGRYWIAHDVMFISCDHKIDQIIRLVL